MLVDSPFRFLYSLLCRVFILLFNSGMPVTSSNRRTLLNELLDNDEVTPIRKSCRYTMKSCWNIL